MINKENILNVSSNIDENISYLKSLFNSDNTVKERRFTTRDGSCRLCIFFVDGMVNDLLINQNILYPLMNSEIENRDCLYDTILDKLLPGDDLSEADDINEAILNMLTGDTIIFIDGSESCITISTKKWSTRSVDEPDSERVSKGPREGFTESLLVNLSLIRRKLCTPNLKFEFLKLGRRSNTKCCICYIDGIVNRKILDDFKNRIKQIDIDIILDTNYVEELIKERRFSPFKTTGSTERPDVVAAKLLEGRIAFVADGTPSVLSVPFLFPEYFRSNDDYYSNYFYGSFGRLLRILGFFLTISIPAVYLSLVTFHMEMLPTKFLLNIFETRTGLAFTSFFEMVVMILVFELIREGSAKIPSDISGTLSIVGGLVLGQASVEAKFVSLPIVIIVAFTGITGLMIPQLKGPAILLRLGLLAAASVFGIFGYMLGMIILLIYLTSMSSFGIPYMSLQSEDFRQTAADTAVRLPWQYMVRRPSGSSGHDKIRQKRFNLLKMFTMVISTAVVLLTLCGCSSGREIDELTPVAGLAVDSNNIVCAEKMLNNSELAGDNASSSIMSSGSSFSDAMNQFSGSGNRELLLSHASVVFISLDHASDAGISEIIDYCLNDVSIRLNTFVCVTDMPLASDIFSLKTGSTNIKSYDIHQVLTENSGRCGGVKGVYQIADEMHSGSRCYTLPLISAVTQGDDDTAVINGAGIFQNDKLVSRLTPDEALFLGIMRGDGEGVSISLNNSIYKIEKCSADVVCTETSSASVNIALRVSKTSGSHVSSDNDRSKNSFPESASLKLYIERSCERLVEKVMISSGCDIFGISNVFNNTHIPLGNGASDSQADNSQGTSYETDPINSNSVSFSDITVDVNCDLKLKSENLSGD